MYNSKPNRSGSKYNANNVKAAIDPKHYPFMQFPKESAVQPGELVVYSNEAGQTFRGTVLEDGAYMSDDVIYVRVNFDDYIDAVAAELLTKFFDYETLDAETRIVVQQKTSEIKTLMRRTTQDIIDIGTKLVDVKAKLGHGNFGKWLSAEFGWSDRTARKFMAVANAFKSESGSDLNIGAKALYLLAEPSTPEEARQEAIERAEAGEFVTHAVAKAIVTALKPAQPPVVPAPQPSPTWKDEATRVFAPVTRPPTVTYGKVEDSYQDDVPSVDVDDEDLSGDEWINKALAGELPVTQPVTFQVGDTVSTKFGRTGGKVIELHDELGVMVHFEGYSPWWMKADVLVLTKRGNGTPKEPITEADYELPETATFKVGDKIRTINGHREGIVVKVDGVDAYRTYVEMRNGERYWTDAHWLELSDTNVIAQARADLEHITDSPAKQRLTTIVDQQEKADADRQQRLANWQEHERRRTLAAQTPPPQGQYRTIVIDPPWPMKKIERGVRPNQGTYLDYPTMQLRDIYALGIEQLAADDGCHLYLWTTHKFLPEALKLTSHWGFRYNCLMTWVKTSGMTPYHYRFNTEHVLFATRGSMAVQRKGLSLAFEGDSLGHSRKPDTFYDMIAQASPGPRIDMFARCERAGFSLWGFESELS